MTGVPLAFAGLWESWRDPETEETTLFPTIIVGAANEWMIRFHDRMPVLLEPVPSGSRRAAFGTWE
ncbi:SOS response-associated peptidase family protein [Methylosinus sp. H3A]|uniref:SOS response-associated peptidase family protein n=1 Tax=Methylosinus sp. H3A TaxID=2785786 RepID=UPI001FEEF188|nr:SOS response-associated peptidase family protein [Methylosinus sp. H3A]